MALYREWRPQTFSEVVGQAHITRTLQNAVRLGRLGHAYLFDGPRGTGKTSIAKILSKAVNCQEPRPNGDPCNQCESCRRINSGSAVDVLEIDAASNRGIDEIRELREKVKYSPAESRYKVYIIDEVHMLTNEAFNALLKTLEEPPAHAVFVLATTDPQKVPLTVLSRCQRFDFHRLTSSQILSRLQQVAQGGGLEVEEEALGLVARAAEGGLRDALSLLDQLAAFCGRTVTLDDALTVLGLAPSDVLAEMGQSIAVQDATAALRLVDRVVRQGKDIRQFLRDLMGFLRNALLLQVVGDEDESLLDVAASDRTLLSQVAQAMPAGRLPGILAVLADTENELKWSSQPRLLVELALVKLCQGPAARAEMAPAAPTAVSVSVPPQALQTPNAVGLEQVVARWPEVLAQAKESRPLVYQMLNKGTPVRLEDGNLYVQFPRGLSNYDRGQMTRSERRTVVEEAVAAVLGVRLSLIAVTEGADRGRPQAEHSTEPEDDPAVKRVADFFEGEVVEIRKDR